VPDICLYAQVHQPYRIRRFRLFDIGEDGTYFDESLNRRIARRVADKCYLPTNALLARLIRESGGEFRMALSLSGSVLSQLEAYAPDALESFQQLVDTGCVELLAETYEHSLASLVDHDEFRAQIVRHAEAIQRLFGPQRPRVFRNTELIFDDRTARVLSEWGYAGALVEEAPHALAGRTPNRVYESAAAPGLRLLIRNRRLSDDIAFRFSDPSWDGFPLNADRYASWLADAPGECLNLFMDYETFGEHQWDGTGIFDFLARLPEACRTRGLAFAHPSELVRRLPADTVAVPETTSWADEERDVSAWLGDRIQRAAHERLYALRTRVLAAQDPDLLRAWRRLTTSDHVYYMSTKRFNDGDVHKYFSPFDTPYDAFIAFMNVLQDLEQRAAAAHESVRPLRASTLREARVA